MKKFKLVPILLAITLALTLGLTACSGPHIPDTGSPDTSIENTIPDTGPLPDAEGKGGYQSPFRGSVKPMSPEDKLKPYGDIKTLTKSIKNPTKPDTKGTSMSNNYGTVDWSTAANGYITFTAKGQERGFILQGPNTGVQADFTVAKDDSIKVALVDGTGKYEYAIANNTNGGKNYIVQYKNSFSGKSIDADLVPYLVSTPWGDYENAPNAVAKAKEFWDSKKTQQENIETLAKYVRSLKYGKKLKQGTIDKYVNPDSVIENGGGVCNEMSKLLVAMLRSQGVPAYYQSGTKNGENHAWVRVWIETSSSTKDNVISSKGAWVNIEATGGRFIPKSEYDEIYNTENKNLAN